MRYLVGRLLATVPTILGAITACMAAAGVIPFADLADKKAAVFLSAILTFAYTITKLYGYFVDPIS